VKRSAELAPLSRDHHVALGIALRLRRAEAADVPAAVAAFRGFFAGHGQQHFRQEEELLVDALPTAMARRLADEHGDIRRRAAVLDESAEPESVRELGELLAAHVRFEEREVFPLLEQRLSSRQLAEIGARLADVR
jgi:hypothetical protein